MIWRDNLLIREDDDPPAEGGARLAAVEDGTLRFGATPLRFTSGNPADLRAEGAHGEQFAVRKTSFTVARYAADCNGAAYELNRTGLRPHREIVDTQGNIVALTAARANGDLAVTVPREITLDIVFMTWCLTLIDAPVRRTRY